MKQKFQISEASSKLALEDAKNFNLSATLEKEDDQLFISYESKAYCDEPCKVANPTWEDLNCLSKSLYSELQYQLKWIREDYQYLSQAFYKHQEGHIPAVKDVGKMKQVIETLGLSDSYDVAKKTIYVEW